MKILMSILAGSILATGLWAADFSSMTMEELTALRGKVPVEERDAFRAEMQKRMQSMTPEERQKYMPAGRTGPMDGTGSRYGKGSGGGMGQGQGMGQGGGMGMGKGRN